MSTNEIRVMTPEDQDIDAAYQRALAAREESAASDIDAAYQRALAAREASGVPPMQVVGGRFSNRSPEMDRFFAGDPAALFPEASREQLAYALGHDPEKNNYWMVQKLGVSQYLGNIYGVPASAVANDFKTYTKAYFGEEIEDPHIAFGRIRELREGREGNTAGTAGRRGYDLAIGMESVGKGIYDVAGVGSGVLAKANAALNSVYFPLAWAADKAGFPEAAAEMRANAGKDAFFTELHRCYRDISDNFRREIAVLSKERGADETFFGEVAGGVLQNLPNLLVAFGTSGMTAPALPKALAGAPGLSRYLPRLTKYLTPLSRIEAADLYFMATSGASEWMDTADDPDMSAAGRVSNALVVGAAEAAFNHLGVMSVYKRWFGSGRITREGAERFASNWIKSVIDSGKEIGVDIVKEGASEVATGLVQRMSRLIAGQNGQSLSRMSYSEIFHALLDEAPLEFSVGAATAGAIGGTGFAGRVRQKVNLAEYEGYLSDNLRRTRDRIAELEEQERRKPLTPDEVAEKETLQQAIAENNPFAIAVAENARIKREAERQARFDDMTPEEISADAVRELKEMQAAERRQAVRKMEEAALPDSPEQLTRRAFEAAVAEYPNLDAAIVGEETELPEHLRQRITSRGYTGGVEGVYDENSGRIWLVAGNVPSSRVGKVLLHEAVGHKSLRELFGVKYDSFLLRLAADHEREIATLAEARGIDFSTEAGKLEAADEFMAQLAETRLAAGTKPKLLARFRLFLRRIGFLRNTSFSDDELTALLARAYGRARRGTGGKVSLPAEEYGQARTSTEAQTDTEEGVRFTVNENGETLFGVAGRDGNLTARQIIDDRSIRPDEPVLTSDGSDVWGEITPEMAAAAPELGLEALPIKLLKGRHTGPHTGYGLAHVYEQHGAELEARGYDLAEYLIGIFSRPHQIYASSQGGNIRLELVNKSKPRDIGVLELRKEDGFYSVITAFPQDFAHYKMRGELVWRYTGSKPNKISQEGSSVISAGKQRTSPLEPLSAENAAGTARVTRPKPDSNINDSGEKSSTSGDGSHFSVSPEHQAKVELMARAVLDRAETAASPEEIMELLNRRGVEIDDIELARQVWIEARETARERNHIIERNRMRDYIRNSDPWIAVLEDVYGSEFHIKPGRKYRDEEFGANHQTGWIDNRKKAGSGIAPDEAAATLSRQFGEEITDDDVIDHFRNLRRSDFTKMRRRDSAELRRLEKEQENLANEVLLDSLREGGVLLDDTLIRNYPQAARQFAREIMPKETPPGEADPIDWQAVKAAQQQQENDMRGYAAGYSQGRAEGEQAGRERLKQARQAFQERYRKKNDDWRKLLKQVRDDRNNIRDVQKLARAFVVNHLPMEERGKFLPQVEKLSTYSGVPTPKHPEGRRNAELEALMSRIMEAEKEYSRNRNIQAIKDMLEAVKVKRNRRGIPVSVVPEIQQTVDRIREIVNMNVPAVNNLISAHNEEIAELEKKHVQSDRLEQLRNDNELLVTFGKLKEQVPEDVRAARELLYHLIRDGRDSLRSRLDARLAEVEAMREQAITEASRGTNVYGKTDADLNFAGMLPQMGLHSLLDIASGSDGADFDRTVAGRLFRKVEESTQREATANRKLQQDFEAFLKGVGVDSRIKKNAFFTMLDRKEEQTGVFRLQYFQESGNKEHPITELGRRPSIRKALSIERARKLVAEYDENGTLSPEFLQQLFKETDLAAYEIPPASIDFLRKQLADFDSGLQQEYEIFGDEADDAELNELRRRFQKGESVVLILPDPSTGYREIEQELSPGSALQVLLTWEQPHYRAGMEWNGWSEKSIEQLRAYLGRHPEVLALGSWMRDYIKQQRPELDRAARDRYGAGLPELENYWPGSFRESLTDAVAPQNGIGGRSYGTMSINPSFLIGRKFQLFDVDTNTSALSVFLTNQIESQHFIAWHETIRDLRSVFGSSKVQKTLRTHYGEKFRQQLVKSIDALANGGGDRALATQFLSNLYRYWVPAKIAVNSASVAKQMAGVISYMNDVPPSQFFKYFFGSSKRFNAEFAEWVEWAKGTDYVKNRMAGGLDKDLIYLMNYTRDSKSYNPISDAMIEYGTLPTRLADLWATLHGGYAVFKYHYDQALKRGTDERSAWNYAALRWQRATDETQQSGYQKDLNEYQRNAGAYRYLTTFLTNPIQVMNLELQTLNQLRFGADKGEARSKLARQVLVNHIMLPTLMVGITEFFRHGTEWDEYEWEDFFASWLLGPFEGAFIIGKVLAGALNLGADIAVGRSARPRALFQALPVIDEAMLSAYSLYRTLAKEKPFEADDYLKMLKNIGDIGVLGGTAAAPVGAAGTIISAFTREIRRFRRLFAGQQQ